MQFYENIGQIYKIGIKGDYTFLSKITYFENRDCRLVLCIFFGIQNYWWYQFVGMLAFHKDKIINNTNNTVTVM